MTNGVSSIFVSYKILKEKQKYNNRWSTISYYSFLYLFFFLIYLIFNVKTALKVKTTTTTKEGLHVKIEKMLRNLNLKHSIVECVSKSEGEWQVLLLDIIKQSEVSPI